MSDHEPELSESRSPSLAEILEFLVANWKLIAGCAAAGLAAAWAFSSTLINKYEAGALVEMAQIVTVRGNEDTGPAGSVVIEQPALVAEKLRRPTTYTPDAVAACGFKEASDGTERMVSLIVTAQPKNLPTFIDITARLDSPEAAQRCVAKVFEMVRGQQAALVDAYKKDLRGALLRARSRLNENRALIAGARKESAVETSYFLNRDESVLLARQISNLEWAIAQESETRLAAPVHASSYPVGPNRRAIRFAGLLLGLIGGVAIAALRRALRYRLTRTSA